MDQLKPNRIEQNNGSAAKAAADPFLAKLEALEKRVEALENKSKGAIKKPDMVKTKYV